jgi:large subunit ribosomal protein L23
MKDLYTIIKRPIITEKALDQKEEKHILCFEVNVNANKQDVKQAVEKLFKVKVDTVTILNLLGKERRRGRYTGFKPDWKKAYVKLKAGEKMIEFAENI